MSWLKALIVFTILIGLPGCSDDDVSTDPNGFKLQEIWVNGLLETKYVYRDDGLLDSIITNPNYSFSASRLDYAMRYDEVGRLIRQDAFTIDDDGTYRLGGSIFFRYDHLVTSYGDSIPGWAIHFLYKEGVCTERLTMVGEEIKSRTRYSYHGNFNIVEEKREFYFDDGMTFTDLTMREFDSNPKPRLWFQQILPGFPQSTNNPTRRVITDLDLPGTSVVSDCKYDYQYNSVGLPTEQQKYFLSEEGAWVESRLTEYVYLTN